MGQSKFEIFKGKDDEFYFRLKAGNGEVIIASEGYTTKANCNNGIQSVKENSKDENHFEKLQAKDGQYYFNLKASNGQIIGTSEMYTTSSARDHGIQSVHKNASAASVVDLTLE